MGKLEWVNINALSGAVISSAFEPGKLSRACLRKDANCSVGLKSELREYESPDFYNYLTETVIPGVKVAVQFLAAENEVVWDNETASQGRSLFNDLVSLFQSSTEIEAEILPHGGHNYEFSKNAGKLLECRSKFVQKLVSCLNSTTAIAIKLSWSSLRVRMPEMVMRRKRSLSLLSLF